MLLQWHRCCQQLRVGPSRLFVANTALHTRVASRQLITCVRNNKNEVFRISDKLKQSSFFAQLSSTSPKPKTPKAVGYWLLGCSGMVFTAVVLGMVSGYLILLYSIYYIVRLIVSTTNGK